MAALTAASLSVPSFCGLKASSAAAASDSAAKQVTMMTRVQRPAISASMNADGIISKATSVALVASTALALMGSPALAAKIEVGDEVGSFKFTPSTITVAAGEAIEFTLVGETGHNVVFDVEPTASNASELQAASMGENDLLSEDEPTFTAKISTPGTYTYYCTPHKSANMKGTIIVK